MKHITSEHHVGKRGFCLFQCNYCQINQTKRAHNIQAQGRQERMMFLSATFVRKNYKVQSNQGSTTHPSTRRLLEDDIFNIPGVAGAVLQTPSSLII